MVIRPLEALFAVVQSRLKATVVSKRSVTLTDVLLELIGIPEELFRCELCSDYW